MVKIICGDALVELRQLPAESVHCCVTSPPYWGLRDYAATGQLGLEKTPEEYVAKMVEIFREVRRVLRRDGTLWCNMGDTYNSRLDGSHGAWNGNVRDPQATNKWKGQIQSIPAKNLMGIPWRLAFGLQADGWILRSDIIWAKPNPMPESVTDRPTKAHEYLFLLTKSANYFYDAEAIKEKAQYGFSEGALFHRLGNGDHDPERGGGAVVPGDGGSRNKRSVWTIATQPYPEAHFATYPPDLIKPCIMAGTSARGCCAKCGAPWERIVERGELIPDRASVTIWEPIKRDESKSAWSRPGGKVETVAPNCHYENKTLGWKPSCAHLASEGEPTVPCTVLDPFAGSGTTGAVALELGRKAVLIELNPKYVDLIKERCTTTIGLALA